MPLFSKKNFKTLATDENIRNNAVLETRYHPQPPIAESPQIIFHCQLAHGSPTGLISGFSSIRELYQKIADCYDISVDDVIFCTLNTHKVDMENLLCAQIGLDDFIFAHKRGQAKEIELIKSADSLGLTITDNGAGFAFIKRIKEKSVIHNVPHICVGDHIERLNDKRVVGKKHYEVARMLKDIPLGESFSIRLIEPLKSGFQCLGPRAAKACPIFPMGKDTLRFKATGAIIEQRIDEHVKEGIVGINNLLDSFMGINDNDLALQIWDMSNDTKNSMEFAEVLDNSDLQDFGFTDDFVIELWGTITDARRKGKINSKK